MSCWIRLTTLLAACLVMTACSLFKGGPVISDQVWMLNTSYPSSAAAQYADYIPEPCPKTDTAATAAPFTDTSQIDQCVYAMLQLIDVKWVHFQDELLTSSSNSNFAADTTLLGVGAAGSFVAGTTTQILHAVSAGVTGMRSSFNQDILYSQTITTILLQMEADRNAERNIIMAKLTQKPGTAADGSALDTSPYVNMYQAANDLFFYARAGSWTHALLSIQKSAANSKGNTPGGAASNGTPTAAIGITLSPPSISTPSSGANSGVGTLQVLLSTSTYDTATLTLTNLGGATITGATDQNKSTLAVTPTSAPTIVAIPANTTSVTINLKGLKPPTTSSITLTATGTKNGAAAGATSVSIPVSSGG